MQPAPDPLGLLPSGPDPIGERYVRKPVSRRLYRLSGGPLQAPLGASKVALP